MKEFKAWVSRDEDGRLKIWTINTIMSYSMRRDGEDFETAMKNIGCDKTNLFSRVEQYGGEEFMKKTGKLYKGVWHGTLMEECILIHESDLPRMVNPKWEDDQPIEVEILLRPIIK